MPTVKNNTFLSPLQQLFLLHFDSSSINGAFYLSGGTSLSAFYLGHRYSEDIDLFTDQNVDLETINAFVQSLPSLVRPVYERKYDRKIFYLEFKEGILHAQFDYFPYDCIEKFTEVGKLRVDSLKDVAANKIFALIDRNDPKDWVDLYAIFQLRKDLTPETVISLAIKKFQLKGLREALQGKWLSGPPDLGKLRLTNKLALDSLGDYFRSLAKSSIRDSI